MIILEITILMFAVAFSALAIVTLVLHAAVSPHASS